VREGPFATCYYYFRIEKIMESDENYYLPKPGSISDSKKPKDTFIGAYSREV
jgi:hypothetical protein